MTREQPSLIWLSISALGGALAALILAGIAAGRSGVAITPPVLVAAAAVGALPRVVALLRGRWAVRLPELMLVLLAGAIISGVGLWLAQPSLLPLGRSVDAVHQFQLVHWVAVEQRLPPIDARTQGLMGEMIAYPPGFAFVVAAASALVNAPTLETMYPTVALLGGLCAALIALLAVNTAGVSGWRIVIPGLGTLVLLLAHRAYFLEAYIDSSYYAQVLGLALVLLACAWPICEPRMSLLGVVQLGLLLAALLASYPLWLPVPLLFAALVLVTNALFTTKTPTHQEAASDESVSTKRRAPSVLMSWWLRLGTLLAPVATVAVFDLSKRLGVGQAVLEHQGVVTAPSLFGLLPLVLAIPAALLLWLHPTPEHAHDTRLSVLNRFWVLVSHVCTPSLTLALAITGFGFAALLVAAQVGLTAQYHSVKLLFLIVPLAVAVVGVGLIRLTSVEPLALRVVGVIGAAVVLGLTSARFMLPIHADQIVNADLVAASRWLLTNDSKAAEKAIAVGTPIGPDGYWLQVALLGQWRDEAQQAVRSFTLAPPTPEGWAFDSQLPDTVIAATMGEQPPGTTVVQRFGTVAVLRRVPLDLAAVEPLVIRYESRLEDNRLKTALELIRPVAGPLPLVELRLLHGEELIATFQLPPNQQRTKNQYLGVDLDPATLAGSGYINAEAFPTFAAPAAPPMGEYHLVLRLTVGQQPVDERLLATFNRVPAGELLNQVLHSGELVYFRHTYPNATLDSHTASFGTALALTGWHAGIDKPHNAVVAMLHWQPLETTGRSLTTALHLLDPAGVIVATSRSAPQNGFYPTWRWHAGEAVIEQRTLVLPGNLVAGRYTLIAAVYDEQGAVLPLAAGEQQLGQLEIAR